MATFGGCTAQPFGRQNLQLEACTSYHELDQGADRREPFPSKKNPLIISRNLSPPLKKVPFHELQYTHTEIQDRDHLKQWCHEATKLMIFYVLWGP